ncbi:hypothetical protein C8R45DRAFT_929017 [Mycena sanguinolenta]|nr:hypothetical protein C8R45DRAFT_929017 [Mycena sanguinolenta]
MYFVPTRNGSIVLVLLPFCGTPNPGSLKFDDAIVLLSSSLQGQTPDIPTDVVLAFPLYPAPLCFTNVGFCFAGIFEPAQYGVLARSVLPSRTAQCWVFIIIQGPDSASLRI